MSDPAPDHPPSLASPTTAVLTAWLADSHDLLALTDADGKLAWANEAFSRSTGLTASQTLLALAPSDWQDGAPHAALNEALGTLQVNETPLCLRGPTGEPLWVRLRITAVDAQRLWTLQDISASHALEARARHLSELLDMAQEFGRLGVWERKVPSGEGRWDRHVFKFFGMDPTEGTPDFALASARMHPEDRKSQIFIESTRRAGRYSRRYRVVHTDGSLRWIHSQWEVKNSAQGVPERTIGIMMDDTEAYELARSLDAATAHLSLAAELGNIIIWRHDLATGLMRLNERGRDILGLGEQADAMTIDQVRALIHPDDLAGVLDATERGLMTDRPIDVVARYRRTDGAWRTLLARRVVERDATGVAIAFVGVSLDITEQAEQTRRAQQFAERLEAAARAGQMGIWSTALGIDETEWNAQMFELFDRIPGPQAPSMRDWLAICVHPDDAARVGETIQAYTQGHDGALETEFRIRTRDDRIRWIVLRADIDHAEGAHRRVFGIAMDVTDQHAALSALQAASQRSSLIAHHAGIGTWETDANGLNTLWDEQMFRLRGLAPRNVALNREERLALLHPDDRAITLDTDPATNGSVSAASYEFRVRWPDGSVHWLASRSAPVYDKHGQIVHRMGVNWDITESKSAELARQQVQLAERESQAKSRFLSRMSHELRTPLNAVLGFTQLLQTDARASAARERLVKLNHIRAAGEHLLALINDALDLSRVESGTLKLDLQPLSIARAIRRALPLLESLAAANAVTVRIGVVNGVALADSARLHQVLLNLLGNAIKNGRSGGEVLFDAESTGAHVMLRVSDRERSLHPEQLAHLFEPFNRLGVDGEGIESTGIGLTIARAMVESMGGEINVTSAAPLGTVFALSLPSAAISADLPVWSALAPIANDTPAPPQRDGCLLYIEDNEVNVLLVEELVKGIHGLRFSAESTGDAGVATAARIRPDLILVDLQLPDFDGYEVLRRLRAQPQTAYTPCIALSANALPEDIERGRAAGFDDYWTKPIRFKPFIDALERLFPLDDAPTAPMPFDHTSASSPR